MLRYYKNYKEELDIVNEESKKFKPKKWSDNIQFKKIELSLNKIATRTIKQPKVQEISNKLLFVCIFDKKNNLIMNTCSKDYQNEAVQTLSKRLGAPLYIPLISIITSFLLIYKKEKKYNFLKKYILFILSFVILIFAEILLKYTGFSLLAASSYFILPLVISFLFYIYLYKIQYRFKKL